MTKIKNTQKKPTANEEYYYVAHIGEGGCVTHLMLTEKEFQNAKKRADKNPEDLPRYSIAIQLTNEKSDNDL